MKSAPSPSSSFAAEVAGRFGLLPNFFQTARAAPGLIQELWGFAKASYLDNPMPSVFKERLFVWLSRFCTTRYCIVRHVGFLLGQVHGHAAGDVSAARQSIADVVYLLRCPTPWKRDMAEVYARLEALPGPIGTWPESGDALEDAIFACAAVMFVEPARSERARRALTHAIGSQNFELFSGFLAFIRTAHYWTMLHPEIETEEDMLALLRDQEELAKLLLQDPESDRCQMGGYLFEELSSLRELHERRELERAKAALEEKDRQKDEFIAVLAHELRNPLAAIRAANGAMRLMPLADQRAARLLERVDRQTTAMARMLEDLLDASRIALGKVSVEIEPVRLDELLKDILDEAQPRTREAGLQVEARVSEPCVVKADRVRLRQVLDNLLSNAIKFTPAGGTISVLLAKDADFAKVILRDTGVGFDEGFAHEIFEPFTQQEQQGRDRSHGGLGLGLAISSRLATLQGGSLSAESAGRNQGAAFTLRMPLAEPAVSTQRADAPAARSERRNVLLVEDSPDVAASLAELLELVGCKVHVARDGPAAMQAALELVPDVVLCDLGLPGEMDGFAVARACRAEQSLRSTRLVAISGYSSRQDRTAAALAGFDDHLVKPVDLRALQRALSEGSPGKGRSSETHETGADAGELTV